MTGLAINQQDFQKKVTEQVQTTFMNLLPEDAFAELVAKEVNAFFNEDSKDFKLVGERIGYTSDVKMTLTQRVSPFRQMVWNEVHKLVDSKLHDHFTTEGFNTVVSFTEHGESHVLSELMERKLEQMATKLAASMFTNMFGAAMQQAKQDTMAEVMHYVQTNRPY